MYIQAQIVSVDFSKGQGKIRGYATVFSIFLLACFQSCSLTDLHCDPLETSEDCQGHSSDKSEPGWNSSFNFQGTRL